MEEGMNMIEISSVKHETPKAWLAIMDDGKEIWFPKSQCKLDGTTLSIPEWLSKEKGC